MIEVTRLVGKEVEPYLADLARLRIAVFREFPYLYDGSENYERGYLEAYAASPRSVFVLARENGRVIGVSTGLPLAEADGAFQKPFMEAGLDPADVFYLGESVLEKDSRGRGLGHRFFDEREKHAVGLGFRYAAFCAVERPGDHPLRPEDYRPLDAFWKKRGYEIRPELKVQLEWKQIDQGDDVENLLTFRLRSLP